MKWQTCGWTPAVIGSFLYQWVYQWPESQCLLIIISLRRQFTYKYFSLLPACCLLSNGLRGYGPTLLGLLLKYNNSPKHGLFWEVRWHLEFLLKRGARCVLISQHKSCCRCEQQVDGKQMGSKEVAIKKKKKRHWCFAPMMHLSSQPGGHAEISTCADTAS